MSGKVYIVAAKRTAVGAFLGGLKSLSAVELASSVIRSALQQASISPEDVDEVIVGNVLSAGLGQGVARQAAMHAGITHTTPAYSLNMICGSGAKSVINAYNAIYSKSAEVVVAAGSESMSNAAFVMEGKCRQGNKMGDISLTDTMLKDGLIDAFDNSHMGVTAENIAKRYSISRQEQDEFALRSQHRAKYAIENGHFATEIVPLSIKTRTAALEFSTDEHPRKDASIESLAGLRPAFQERGSVTAGNSSGLNDGAAALVLVSQEYLQRNNLTPLAEIVSVGQGGVEPEVMGLGPIPAIKQALERATLSLRDVERLELNEAFAAQAIGVMKGLSQQHDVGYDWFDDKTNLNGGAIALGHPIGASGARVLTTLVYELIRSNTTLGLASLCIGGGMGSAIVIKRAC
ncbi:3-ketoacyl-CoA thiolase [Vibrio ponticus]|nr:3-ketoacyl-CoA thiolase [Vibrio ponticus]